MEYMSYRSGMSAHNPKKRGKEDNAWSQTQKPAQDSLADVFGIFLTHRLQHASHAAHAHADSAAGYLAAPVGGRPIRVHIATSLRQLLNLLKLDMQTVYISSSMLLFSCRHDCIQKASFQLHDQMHVKPDISVSGHHERQGCKGQG